MSVALAPAAGHTQTEHDASVVAVVAVVGRRAALVLSGGALIVREALVSTPVLILE